MKKLGGLGRGANHVTKIEYKNTTDFIVPNLLTVDDSTEVADLMAQYVEDAFQPLQEPDFDYAHFNCIEQEWNNSPALNNSIPITLPINAPGTVEDLNPFNITWPSPLLRGQDFQDYVTSTHSANPTKHQSLALQDNDTKVRDRVSLYLQYKSVYI